MRKLCLLGMCMVLLCGCIQREVYKLKEQEKAEITIENDAYFLSGQQLMTINKSSYEEADIVYYVEDEWQLCEAIQYALENGEYKIAYQSEQELDIHQVASILSYINPFDLSLTQNVVKYTSNQQDVLYCSYHVTIENMDNRYVESQGYIQDILDTIITKEMSINDKIKAIHDYIITHTIYDVEAQKSGNKNLDVFKAAGVFVDHKAVCTGYSRAFMMLAKAAGIPAIYVSSEEMNHSWNYVYDGYAWRYIDVTWDDPVSDRGMYADDRFLHVPKEIFLLNGTHVLTQDERDMVEKVAESFF